jgi:hypothetical protein
MPTGYPSLTANQKQEIINQPSKRGFAIKSLRLNWKSDSRKTAIFWGSELKPSLRKNASSLFSLL